MSDQQFFNISEIARMFDISARTIRYYEELGLITPQDRSNANKQRRYSDQERVRLKLILRGKKLGFSLQEIKEMVDLYQEKIESQHTKQHIIAMADQKLRALEDQIEELQLLKEDLESLKKRYLAQ